MHCLACLAQLLSLKLKLHSLAAASQYVGGKCALGLTAQVLSFAALSGPLFQGIKDEAQRCAAVYMLRTYDTLSIAAVASSGAAR